MSQEKFVNSRRQLWMLSFLILDLLWLYIINGTDFWSVTIVKCFPDRKHDHFFTVSITAVASFSIAV